jgi:NADH-quinone oxidoreductase subunit H
VSALESLALLLVFPGGLFVALNGLAYEWLRRKLVARCQNRLGPPWFQPLADFAKLLAKQEIVPTGVEPWIHEALPVVALAAVLTAAVCVPLAGFPPVASFAGDLVVTVYLLSLPACCLGLAGAATADRFSRLGATRTLTQLFACEAPFLLALVGPALVAGSWRIADVARAGQEQWLIVNQPLGFVVALLGLVGKLELPPLDAPGAETEIVGGSLTEYGGRGLGLFLLAREIELVVGLSLIAAFYLGGLASPLAYVVKTTLLLLAVVLIQVLFTRLRIDQAVHLWWRVGALLAVGQLLVLVVLGGLRP